MRSVSTLALSIGATSPSSWINGCITETPKHCVINRYKCPATAAAAAIAGLTRWVLSPAPWRPSITIRGTRATLTGQQAVSIHCKAHGAAGISPPSLHRENLVQALDSARALTSPEPGTTKALRIVAAIRRPLSTAAAALSPLSGSWYMNQ